MNAKEADLKFKEFFGQDSLTGINFDYSKLIPETLIESLNSLKSTLTVDTNAPLDRKGVYDEIEDLISSYETIKNTCPENTISKDMTSLVIGCSQIYDNEMCNFVTSDMIRGSKNPVSSRFTRVVYDAISLNDDSVYESLTSLINTVIEYFDPCVVAKVLSAIILRNSDSAYFTEERVRGYYEALINRENVIYSGKYISITESVGFTYFETTYTSVEDLLSDKHGVYKLISFGTNIVYGEVFKRTITNAVLEEILRETSGRNDDPCIVALRHIRNDVESWIKHKDLSERPECPESFKYIDINHFISALYTSGIHILGDTDAIVSKFESEYDSLDAKLDEEGLSTEESEKIKVKMNALKSRKTEYLTLKSNIAFLFMEILSNEKVVYKVFNEELVSSIILMEPGFNFGMNDVNNNVADTFIKRDFTPVLSNSINPYYVHFGEQELSTPNAKYIAAVISSLVHPNMKSTCALAAAYDFETLENVVKSLKYHYIKSLDIYNNVVKSCENRIDGICKQYEAELPNEIISIVKTVEGLNLEKDLEIKKLLEENIKNEAFYNANQYLISSVTEISEMTKWIEGCKSTTNNIIGQIDFVIGNITSDETITSATKSCNEKKPIIDFWPITQSYEYEIEDPIDNYGRDDSGSMKIGDITHHRYGHRYKVSNPDD